jgi:serine/threonine-protein kinase RsbW
MPISPLAMGIIPANGRERTCCEIRTTIPATLDAIEQILAELRRHCHCVLRSRGRFEAELLLREALTNAVVHGSHSSPARAVRCVLRMKGRVLTISVRDEGEGFDWRDRSSREVDSCSVSGRGIEIFRKYATRFRFNDKGNAVTIVKCFDDGVLVP